MTTIQLVNTEPQYKPCKCPDCDTDHLKKYTEVYYTTDINNNFALAMKELGLKIYANKAEDLIPHLKEKLTELIDHPAHFKRFEATGALYEYLIVILTEILSACKYFPKARVEIS